MLPSFHQGEEQQEVMPNAVGSPHQNNFSPYIIVAQQSPQGNSPETPQGNSQEPPQGISQQTPVGNSHEIHNDPKNTDKSGKQKDEDTHINFTRLYDDSCDEIDGSKTPIKSTEKKSQQPVMNPTRKSIILAEEANEEANEETNKDHQPESDSVEESTEYQTEMLEDLGELGTDCLDELGTPNSEFLTDLTEGEDTRDFRKPGNMVGRTLCPPRCPHQFIIRTESGHLKITTKPVFPRTHRLKSC